MCYWPMQHYHVVYWPISQCTSFFIVTISIPYYHVYREEEEEEEEENHVYQTQC